YPPPMPQPWRMAFFVRSGLAGPGYPPRFHVTFTTFPPLAPVVLRHGRLPQLIFGCPHGPGLLRGWNDRYRLSRPAPHELPSLCTRHGAGDAPARNIVGSRRPIGLWQSLVRRPPEAQLHAARLGVSGRLDDPLHPARAQPGDDPPRPRRAGEGAAGGSVPGADGAQLRLVAGLLRLPPGGPRF